jgi:hypothetical protein
MILWAGSAAAQADLRGQVLSGGAPAPGQPVTLFSSDGVQQRFAVTDSSGVFFLYDVPGGAYFVMLATGVRKEVTVPPDTSGVIELGWLPMER